MKSILVVILVVLCCGWLCTRCARWSAEKEAQALESCKIVHSAEQCEAWAGRGY